MAAREPEEKLADSSAPDDVTLRDEAMKGTGATEPSAPNDAQDDATRFLSGFKLWVVMAGVTVVVLLAMLDISIIGTVGPQPALLSGKARADPFPRPFPKSRATSTGSRMLVGISAPTSSPGDSVPVQLRTFDIQDSYSRAVPRSSPSRANCSVISA